jgi:MSHA biogenesis protein MshQ
MRNLSSHRAPTKIALLLLLLCARSVHAIAPEGSWWNAAYGYRQRIDLPVSGGTLSSGYAVSVTFDHATQVTAGRSLANGNDVRIAFYNGASWVELDRIVDPESSWNSATSRIWFQTQVDIASGTTENDYYIYYGNTAPGAPPANSANIFLLTDDFDGAALDETLWTNQGPSPAIISGGGLSCPNSCVLRSLSEFGGNTIWEASVSLSTASPPNGRFSYWLASNANNYSDEHVGFYLQGNGNHTAVSEDTTTDTRNVSAVAANTFRTYSFARIGTTSIRFFVNGTQVGGNLNDASDVPNDDLPVLVRNQGGPGTTMNYEWIRVRPYRSTEPTLTLAGREQLAVLAQYRLDEVSWNGSAGEVVDSAAYGLNGVAVGSANTANASPAITGSPGTCRYGVFNGSSQYAQVADNALLDISAALTVSAWIYPRSYGAELKSIVSKDTNFEFHLTASGQINWWWNDSAGTTRDFTTTGAAIPLNQWTHVAITYRSGSQRIYINGVQRGSATNSGALIVNNWAMQIGYDGASSAQPGRYWNGYIDEVNIYSTALSSAQVSSLMSLTRPCLGGADHYTIEHDGYGIHCLAETIRVNVRDAANNEITNFSELMTLNTGAGNGDWVLVEGNGALNNGASNDGIATYQWVSGEGFARFALTYREGPASINITASSATISDDNTESNLQWGASGFMVTASPLSNPPTLPITSFAAPQTAGVAFDMYIAAYGTTPTDTQCGIIESYAGNRSVKFWSTYDNPNTGTRIVQVDGNNIATTEAASAVQTVNFVNGQATVSTLYRDAGSIRIGIKDDTVSEPVGGITGGTNNFVVRPASFVVSGIQRTSGGFANPGAANATGAVFMAAGAAFSATVTAVDAGNNTTPNYGRETPAESVQLQSNLILPVGGANPGIGGSFGAFTNGVASGTAFSWAEVGIITLTPSVLDGNYMGAGNVSGTTTGNVGRFIPNDFQVTATGPGSFASSCAPASYIYMGQPMTYSGAPTLSLTARAFGGGTTQNYQGAFFKLQSGAPTTFTYSTNTGTLNTGSLHTTGNPVAASLGNGLASLAFDTTTGLSFQHTAPPIAPFTPTLSMSVDVRDTDNVTTSTNPHEITGISSPEQRWGRVAFRNAVGSELLNLPLGLRAEYFLNDNAGFVQNTDDACTTNVSIDPLSLAFGGSLNSGETCILDTGSPGLSGVGCAAAGSAGSQFRAPPWVLDGGNFNAILRAPGAGNGGTVTLTAVVPDWLLFDWIAGTPGLERPSGIATFGIFQGNSKRIYQGEK